MPDANVLHDRIASRAQADLNDLLGLLRLPSVSTDPSRTAAMRDTVDYLARDLQDAGFTTDVWETGGHPALYAQRMVDDTQPTVLVYGHYDVQPADPLELWNSDPFDPQIVDGRIVARGASDDKGQVYAHVKAVQALHETTGTLPCNVKFLIEGEEEIGSPNLAATVEAHLADLQSDVVLISDGAMLPGPTPTLTYGLRGLAYLEVRLTTADRDLHSGAYGGGAPNPIQALARMIAGLKDNDGRITVPGSYEMNAVNSSVCPSTPRRFSVTQV
jgi:acetylornithine deacetylase/succinyl-diaminopimelate desuccinylase-like protein